MLGFMAQNSPQALPDNVINILAMNCVQIYEEFRICGDWQNIYFSSFWMLWLIQTSSNEDFRSKTLTKNFEEFRVYT